MRGQDALGISLRPVRPDEIAALAHLWVQSWQETLPEIDFSARRGWIETFLQRSDLVTLVVESGGLAKGFVSVEPACAHLHQLVVSPAAKGAGLATALLDAAKAGAPEGLTLDVNQANARALRFYEREGFVRTSAGVNETSGLTTWRMVWRASV